MSTNPSLFLEMDKVNGDYSKGSFKKAIRVKSASYHILNQSEAMAAVQAGNTSVTAMVLSISHDTGTADLLELCRRGKTGENRKAVLTRCITSGKKLEPVEIIKVEYVHVAMVTLSMGMNQEEHIDQVLLTYPIFDAKKFVIKDDGSKGPSGHWHFDMLAGESEVS